jgi:hypothetical protein
MSQADGALKWKDRPEAMQPEEFQKGPTLEAAHRAFLPDHAPITGNYPPVQPTMKVTEGSQIKWQNVFNIIVAGGIIIFLLSLNY